MYPVPKWCKNDSLFVTDLYFLTSVPLLMLLFPLPGIASIYPHVAVKFQPTCHLLHKVFLHPSKYFLFLKKKKIEVLYLIPYRIKLKFCPFALLSYFIEIQLTYSIC